MDLRLPHGAQKEVTTRGPREKWGPENGPTFSYHRVRTVHILGPFSGPSFSISAVVRRLSAARREPAGSGGTSWLHRCHPGSVSWR